EGRAGVGPLVRGFTHRPGTRKPRRMELDARRRDLEIVLANITAGVVSADPRGRVTTLNRAAAELLGVDGAAAVGRPLGDRFPGDAHAELRPALAELLATGGRAGTRLR